MMRPIGLLAPLLLLTAILAGCESAPQPSKTSYQVKDTSQTGKTGTYKVGKPYQIAGVWYYPTEDYSYDETGIASWYGPDFHGKFTANGEVFNQNDVTAAHRTLPLPSIVRVTNLDNGRSIILRVNDRGPFTHGRILDLSKHAAELLDIDLKGTARVRVQIMADESRTLALQMKSGEETPLEAAPRVAVQSEVLPAPKGREAPPAKTARTAAKPIPAPPPNVGTQVDMASLDQQVVEQLPPRSTQIFIQAGAFTRFDNANRLRAALSAVGTVVVSQVQVKGTPYFRVRLGPLATVADADALLERVIASGYPDARVIVD